MFKNFLNIKYPIIQSPMAGGITCPQFVAQISNIGALGFIAAGLLPPKKIQNDIENVRSLTDKPFGVNFFVFKDGITIEADTINETISWLQPIYDKFGIKFIRPYQWGQSYQDQFAAIIEMNPEIVSFTFGIPSKQKINLLKEKKIKIMGTATTYEEVLKLQQSGVDAIILQGIEAGGHRGSFLNNSLQNQLPLIDLLKKAKDATKLPLIAAGGISTADDMFKLRSLGANMFQIGTVFLCSHEAGTHKNYKQALKLFKDRPTKLTRLFSGKIARAVVNNWIMDNIKYENKVPNYPFMRTLIQDLIRYATENNNPEYMCLFAGKSFDKIKEDSAENILLELIDNYSKLNENQ